MEEVDLMNGTRTAAEMEVITADHYALYWLYINVYLKIIKKFDLSCIYFRSCAKRIIPSR